jgi:hypothetical protein
LGFLSASERRGLMILMSVSGLLGESAARLWVLSRTFEEGHDRGVEG